MNIFREFLRGKNTGRILFNRLVEKYVKLEGITLDLGCAHKMSYYRFMDTGKGRIFTADFVKTGNVSVILNLERDLPFKDNSVDIYRVLKRGGKFYMSILSWFAILMITTSIPRKG